MRKVCGFTSCTCAKSHPGICSPLKQSIISNCSVCGERKPWSDCADAQAELGLYYPHMPEDKLSAYVERHVLHGAAHFICTFIKLHITLWIFSKVVLSFISWPGALPWSVVRRSSVRRPPLAFHIFDISRIVSRIELKLGGRHLWLHGES